KGVAPSGPAAPRASAGRASWAPAPGWRSATASSPQRRERRRRWAKPWWRVAEALNATLGPAWAARPSRQQCRHRRVNATTWETEVRGQASDAKASQTWVEVGLKGRKPA